MNNATPENIIDPTALLDGHNCQKQHFNLKRQLKVMSPDHRVCQEYVFQDQYLNWYLVYRAVLQDGETYDVGDWVRPSVLQQYGGFNDDCLDAFRQKAFGAFNDAGNDIARLREVASNIAGKLLDPANIVSI